jgi:GNAT superfamily N-acetyltransferase
MRTRTITKSVHNMTDAELRGCRRLYCRDGSSRIISDLVEARKMRHIKSEVILVKEPTGRILSWGLIDRTEHPHALQLYTNKSYRRMGLGSKIVRRAKSILGDTFRHYKHSGEATAFFNKHQLKYPQGPTWLSM